MKVEFDHQRRIQSQPQETELHKAEPGKLGKAGVKVGTQSVPFSPNAGRSVSPAGAGTTNSGILNVEIRGKADEYGVIKNRETKGSFAELMEDQGLDGGQLQKKYMAVMSNSMSSEDFGELMREGYDPANTEVEDAVTILDTIRIAVAKGGGDVVGFTDDLDKEALKEVLGSAAYAESFVAASSLHAPTEQETLYLVENGFAPTVENLYKAKYSAADRSAAGGQKGYYAQEGSGYYAKAAETPDPEGLREQILKVIETAGM